MRALLAIIAGTGAVIGALLAATMDTGPFPSRDLFWALKVIAFMFTMLAAVALTITSATVKAGKAQALRRISQSS